MKRQAKINTPRFVERAEAGLKSCDHARAHLRDMAGWQTSMETLQIIMKHDEGGGVGS